MLPAVMPSDDETELLGRAHALAGRTLASLPGASSHPAGHKGGIGHAVERALGIVVSGSSDVDVPALGIEVKTLPVRSDGRVDASTWVCSAVPGELVDETWPRSRVQHKLQRVLFVPVQARGDPAERRVGHAFLWSPDDEELRVLRNDWEDLADLLARGLGFAVSARRGVALQIRPKAPDATTRVRARIVDDAVGDEDVWLRPQGFYLRRSFTQRIVDRVFDRRA